MKILLIVFLLIFNVSSLSAKDNQQSSTIKNQKMTKEELLKKFMLLDKQEKDLNVIIKALKKAKESKTTKK